MATAEPVRIGTRGSALARWQSEWVAEQLRARGISVELIVIATLGDQQQGPVAALEPGVFTKAIQQALLDHRVDLAVHSLKDLPTDLVPGLILAAVPERASSADVLISRTGLGLDQLAENSVIGTGSSRRAAQLRHLRPDLVVQDIRGNVETRIEKLDAGQYDAIVLAEAGLTRLGLAARVTQILPQKKMLPAVGQGALGLEIRENDQTTAQSVAALDDASSHQAVTAERSMLAQLRGGCLAPVGAWARVAVDALQLDAVVLDLEGKRRITASSEGPSTDGFALGRRVAEDLLSQGAAELLAAARS
ncbi:MAG: hydroxymethylbilane synthase [Pirellulales bacterium]|nr:hydroxymethylbilane synthase [Pirellulales bacterium]